MILVVMVGMSLVFAYVTVYSSSYQAGVGSSVLESMTIEDVWIQNSNTVQISVYNTATQANLGTNSGIDITVATIYVNGVALTTSQGGNSIEFNKVIRSDTADAHQSIVGYWSGTFQSGITYNFKVVSARGSNFDLQYTAP